MLHTNVASLLRFPDFWMLTRFLKGSPFVISFVAFTVYIPPLALVALRLRFVTF